VEKGPNLSAPARGAAADVSAELDALLRCSGYGLSLTVIQARPARIAVCPQHRNASAARAGRDVRFRGLLAPGPSRLSGEEDLVAVWRTTAGQRFQNYRARFTVLDAESAPRTWVREILAGDPLGSACPSSWRAWGQSGTYSDPARDFLRATGSEGS
jgi:hypothetical protein